MNARQAVSVLLLPIAVWAGASFAGETAKEKRQIERGRYLSIIGGCNDCHTSGYMEKAGKVPESEWLTGNALGFQGPWGTTYPANLRLLVNSMTEAQWVARARTPMRPPMPWFNLSAMSDADLRALHRYLRSLGAKGEPAPAYAQPGVAVKTPYINFVPQNLPQAQAAATAR